MKKIKLIFTFLVIQLFFISIANSSSSYFSQGKALFNNKDYKKAKFLFEQDIVFHPKSYNSYLYLAKIYLEEKNDEEQEKNLKTVLILEPSNEEALYMLIKIKLNRSNFSEAKKINKKFDLFCSTLCYKKEEINDKLINSLVKDEKDKN